MVAVTTVPAMLAVLLEVAGAPVVVVATVLVLVPAMVAMLPVATVTTVVVAGVPRRLLENHPSSGASSAASSKAT
jgi:hypothetical protein